MNSEGLLLKAIRICGVLSVLVFGISLMCVPTWSSATGEKIRSSPADDLFGIVSKSLSRFAWSFGGVQALLAVIIIVCASIAFRRSTSTN